MIFYCVPPCVNDVVQEVRTVGLSAFPPIRPFSRIILATPMSISLQQCRYNYLNITDTSMILFNHYIYHSYML